MIIKSFTTEKERDDIVESMKLMGYYLTHENRLFEGNSLVFIPIEEIPPIQIEPPSEIELLQKELAEQKALINAMLGVTE